MWPILSKHQKSSKSSDSGHISSVIWPLNNGHEWKLSNQKLWSGHVNRLVNKNVRYCTEKDDGNCMIGEWIHKTLFSQRLPLLEKCQMA